MSDKTSRLFGVFSLALAITVFNSAQAQLDAIGPETQVNTFIDGEQRFPSVALAPDQSVLVVWQSEGSDGDDNMSFSIQARLYDGGGTPAGNPFQVNQFIPSAQVTPQVARNSQGVSFVVWRTQTTGTFPDLNIHGRLYDTAGNPVSNEMTVNTTILGNQSVPQVAALTDDGFVVVWDSQSSPGTDTQGSSVIGQRYDSGGTSIGPEFQINSFEPGFQTLPDVVGLPDGGFAVVWESSESDFDMDQTSIIAQRFGANGAPSGSEIAVNSVTAGRQQRPEISANAAGELIVVFDSDSSLTKGVVQPSIQMRRFTADGAPTGPELQVNQQATGTNRRPHLSTNAPGRTIVVWESQISGSGLGFSIQAQCIDSAGALDGDQFQVNTTDSGDQEFAQVAFGDFVSTAVWDSASSAGSDDQQESIQLQRIGPRCPADNTSPPPPPAPVLPTQIVPVPALNSWGIGALLIGIFIVLGWRRP